MLGLMIFVFPTFILPIAKQGAIAFALAFILLEDEIICFLPTGSDVNNDPRSGFALKKLFVSSVMALIVFTVRNFTTYCCFRSLTFLNLPWCGQTITPTSNKSFATFLGLNCLHLTCFVPIIDDIKIGFDSRDPHGRHPWLSTYRSWEWCWCW